MQVNTLAVDLLQLAANYSYGSYVQSIQGTDSAVQVLSYDTKFADMMGKNVSASLTDQHDWQFAHEAGVYLPSTRSIYATSQIVSPSDAINVSVIDAATYKLTSSFREPGLVQPNGAARYNDTHLLFCVFGDAHNVPSSLALYEPTTSKVTPLLTSFYGRNFSSINDVRVRPSDGSVWFTDDFYGALEGFRPAPALPAQVYRFDVRTGAVKAVADGFDQPNGLEFSSDFRTLYVADSGYVHAPGDFNGTRPNAIYALDVDNTGTGLVNRRLLASGPNPFVDGMHVDAAGNVWATSGKGISAWDSRGTLLGELRTSTGVNNFLFTPDGILMLGFNKLWHVRCGVRPRKGESW